MFQALNVIKSRDCCNCLTMILFDNLINYYIINRAAKTATNYRKILKKFFLRIGVEPKSLFDSRIWFNFFLFLSFERVCKIIQYTTQ